MASQHTDYYALLGLGRGASAADIDRAYRRAARATHPDVHPDDASAGERFQAVTIAYQTLSDPCRRAAYDHAHPLVRRSTPPRIEIHRRAAVKGRRIVRQFRAPKSAPPAGPEEYRAAQAESRSDGA